MGEQVSACTFPAQLVTEREDFTLGQISNKGKNIVHNKRQKCWNCTCFFIFYKSHTPNPSLNIVLSHWLAQWCASSVVNISTWVLAMCLFIFICVYPQLHLPPWLGLCWGSNFPRVLCYSLWPVLILMGKNRHGSGQMIFAHPVCYNNRLCLLCATYRKRRM